MTLPVAGFVERGLDRDEGSGCRPSEADAQLYGRLILGVFSPGYNDEFLILFRKLVLAELRKLEWKRF